MLLTAAPIDPVAIELGPLEIQWYAIIILAGLLLGLYLAGKEMERLGLDKEILMDFIIFAIPAALIGARLYYVIFEWEHYANGPFWQVFAIWEGGIAIHGAVFAGLITAIIFCRVRKVSFWQLADIVAPSLILGQAIGRWGNFVNQEAHGGPVSEAAYNNFLQYFPDFILNQMTINGTLYHPTFLYESVWNILVFILLIVMIRFFNPVRGEVFLSYAIFYSVGRFFIEGMRTDSLYVVGELRTAQLVSITIIIVGIIFLIYRRTKGNVPRYYDVPAMNKKKKYKKKNTKNKKKK